MKMVMISYNSAIDSEVMDALRKCNIENYTKWNQVLGKGKTSGCHLSSDIWPGENSVIFTAAEEGKIGDLLSCIKELRVKLGKEGVKAFVWPLAEVT
ncbi:MAG: hypothetical protein JW800_00305 [Candidatus Omnitrophica bacterium]|nr:hypothetical protein [Candidatus Omnitrophota bacterium]